MTDIHLLHYDWTRAVMDVLNKAWAAGEVDASDYPVNRIGVIVTLGVEAWLADLYPERCAPLRVSFLDPELNVLLDKAETAGRVYAAALAGGAA